MHTILLMLQYLAIIFREKQIAVHIAFQNTVHGSIFREKHIAVHTAFQNKVHGSIFRAYMILKYSTRLPCI